VGAGPVAVRRTYTPAPSSSRRNSSSETLRRWTATGGANRSTAAPSENSSPTAPSPESMASLMRALMAFAARYWSDAIRSGDVSASASAASLVGLEALLLQLEVGADRLVNTVPDGAGLVPVAAFRGRGDAEDHVVVALQFGPVVVQDAVFEKQLGPLDLGGVSAHHGQVPGPEGQAVFAGRFVEGVVDPKRDVVADRAEYLAKAPDCASSA
jgi:hypothetical protein